MSRFDFGHIPIRECGEPLLLVSTTEFLQEPKYFERGLNTQSSMYLRSGTVDRLRKAQKSLPKGYRLKLWDCYRSREVQHILFEQCKKDVSGKHPKWSSEQVFDEARKFIAIPDRPDEVPPHNTGGTVDLTLVNETEEELNMGTDFDDITEVAQLSYFQELVSRSVEEEAISRNRETLRQAMTEAGFTPYVDEWWHYDYGNQPWALELKEPFAIYGSADNLLPS